MLSPLIGQALDPSLRVLVLPLRMLDALPAMRSASGLPVGALDIAPANPILAATPCEAPLFREQMLAACAQSSRDVLLVHTGLFPEIIDAVTVDVALTEIQLALGHTVLPSSTQHYVIFSPHYLVHTRQALEDIAADLARQVRAPLHARRTQVGPDGRRRWA